MCLIHVFISALYHVHVFISTLCLAHVLVSALNLLPIYLCLYAEPCPYLCLSTLSMTCLSLCSVPCLLSPRNPLQMCPMPHPCAPGTYPFIVISPLPCSIDLYYHLSETVLDVVKHCEFITKQENEPVLVQGEKGSRYVGQS